MMVLRIFVKNSYIIQYTRRRCGKGVEWTQYTRFFILKNCVYDNKAVCEKNIKKYRFFYESGVFSEVKKRLQGLIVPFLMLNCEKIENILFYLLHFF